MPKELNQIRCYVLKRLNFSQKGYLARPLDVRKSQRIEAIQIEKDKVPELCNEDE